MTDLMLLGRSGHTQDHGLTVRLYTVTERSIRAVRVGSETERRDMSNTDRANHTAAETLYSTVHSAKLTRVARVLSRHSTSSRLHRAPLRHVVYLFIYYLPLSSNLYLYATKPSPGTHVGPDALYGTPRARDRS